MRRGNEGIFFRFCGGAEVIVVIEIYWVMGSGWSGTRFALRIAAEHGDCGGREG